MADKVNIGCGTTPTDGWLNFDNSPSLRIAKIPILGVILSRIGLLDSNQNHFVAFAKNNGIQYANAARKIPLKSNSVETLYCSHMLEHLDKDEADRFFVEAYRVLEPKGWIRVSVPDLQLLLNDYSQTGDANKFIHKSLMCVSKPKSLAQKLKLVLFGPRHHLWMYDSQSLIKLLEIHGFKNVSNPEAGETCIPNPGNLNLEERSSESVFVEGQKPQT